MKLIRFFILSVFAFVYIPLFAQDEYHAEIGINGGGSYYLGDANSQLFKNTQLAYSGFFRYCFDARLAAKVELTNTTVSGNGFKNQILATDVCGEFNFFDLEKNEYKQFSKTFSPYIFGGFGGVVYKGNELNNFQNFSMSIPFGIGMKVKLGHRLNFNAQWTTRLLLADNLERMSGFNNSLGLNGSNPFNNDILSTFTIGLSVDIWKKLCDCENSAVNKDSHKFRKK